MAIAKAEGHSALELRRGHIPHSSVWLRSKGCRMSDDAEYLANYKPNQLYIHPGSQGAYATIVDESEELLGEVDVTPRCKLAVRAFYVRDKADFNSLKITKLKMNRFGWEEDGHIQVNKFQTGQMAQFLSIISNLDLSDPQKSKISLEHINFDALRALLSSTKGPELIQELAESPDLHQDIYAVASKRGALDQFKRNLGQGLSEPDWQRFFELNPWIFGHGLSYVFLDKVGPKLEARTTGSSFDRHGKTADGLMRTRAAISQYVLIEIKKDSTKLLKSDAYRSGCWALSDELSSAVTQAQKTTFEFSRDRFRDDLKDADGNDTGEVAYAVTPRSYLVIGDMAELVGNGDKVACFELYRRHMRAPEIITFDELYHRASCIVANISRDADTPPDSLEGQRPEPDWDDDVPF
ncbi:MAG: DUF4263 domain-containing protein [Alphaproteobacteria bacterium]|nr:MAG: DUF4263 domain-containing protein [Alphaproteobacteria bacterium]